jgi:hypothetical protein
LNKKSAYYGFLTCCALHNWQKDGSRDRWEKGCTPSFWEGSVCFHDVCDAQEHLVPASVQQLMSPIELRTFDLPRLNLMGGIGNVDVHAA